MQLPPDVLFDRWLEYLFGQPVGPSGFRESADWWDEQADPELAVAYLTRLFESPEVLLDRFRHDQIDRGLWFLAGESGHLGPLLAEGVAWEDRRRGLLAIEGLYARLFAPVCTDHLGHLDRGPEAPDPLNSACYMWWDLFPTWGGHGGELPQERPGRRLSGRARRRRVRSESRAGRTSAPAELAASSVDEAILRVLARTLELDSEPCREGALHGLGHWHLTHPDRAAAIVDEWLATGPAISADLRQYAASARAGCVL
jgi:hypothetical protein